MIQGLPQRLQKLRTKYGYSQKQVAQKLALSPSIVSGYETGERTPSLEILLALSYIYNCSTDYLLGKQNVDTKYSLNVENLPDKQIAALNALIESLRNDH